MSFTIVPGWVVKSDSQQVYQSRDRRAPWDVAPKMKLVRKYSTQYSPTIFSLSAAVQGVADIFEVNQMVAVCADNQRSLSGSFRDSEKGLNHYFFAKQGDGLRTSAVSFCFRSHFNLCKARHLTKGALSTGEKETKNETQIESACTKLFLLRATLLRCRNLEFRSKEFASRKWNTLDYERGENRGSTASRDSYLGRSMTAGIIVLYHPEPSRLGAAFGQPLGKVKTVYAIDNTLGSSSTLPHSSITSASSLPTFHSEKTGELVMRKTSPLN